MEGRDGLVKKENKPAFIMALLSVAVLWIVDGLVQSQEGTAVSIDWSEQYPRKQQTAAGGENRQGGAAGT